MNIECVHHYVAAGCISPGSTSSPSSSGGVGSASSAFANQLAIADCKTYGLPTDIYAYVRAACDVKLHHSLHFVVQSACSKLFMAPCSAHYVTMKHQLGNMCDTSHKQIT